MEEEEDDDEEEEYEEVEVMGVMMNCGGVEVWMLGERVCVSEQQWNEVETVLLLEVLLVLLF